MDIDENPSGSKRPFGLSFPSRVKSSTNTTTKASTLNRNCPAAVAFSFGDEDDNDNDNQKIRSDKKVMSTFNTKDRRVIEQALQEDPTIFEYDTVHDQVSSTVRREQEIEEKRRIERETKTVKQAKYITGLLKESEKRKQEFERVIERKIQREREAEGDLFADKEVFVTASYKAKLAERQADLEREKLEEKRESMLSVDRQDNIDAFYRFQFKLRTGDAVILEESEKPKFNNPTERSRSNRQLRSRVENDDESEPTEQLYKKAREKSPQQEEQNEDEEIEKIPVKSSAVKVRRINDESSRIYDDEQIEMSTGPKSKKKKKDEKENVEKIEDIVMPLTAEKIRVEQETRIERVRRLCAKRTVGELLDEAKRAYFERQQQRSVSKDYIERAE